MKTAAYVILLVIMVPLFAIEWERTYVPPPFINISVDTTYSSEVGNSISPTSDEGYIVAGYVSAVGTSDIYMVKLDAYGDTLWTKIVGGCSASSVVQTMDGGFIVAGRTSMTGSSDIYVVKTDSIGETIWAMTYDRSYRQYPKKVIQTSDGGFLIAGSSGYYDAYDVGRFDFYVMKINPSGDTIWTKNYGGGWEEHCSDVLPTIDGAYMLFGWSFTYGSGWLNSYVVKVNNLGTEIWSRAYGGGAVESFLPRQSIQTSDGEYIIVGEHATGIDLTNDGFFAQKISLTGDMIWRHTYAIGEASYARSIVGISDSLYLIVGYRISYTEGYDIFILGINNDGDSLFVNIYNKSFSNLGYSASPAFSSDDLVIVGKSYSDYAEDLYLLCVDNVYDTLWSTIIDNSYINHDTITYTLFSYARSLDLSSDGGYIISGCAFSSDESIWDLYLIKTDLHGDTVWTRCYNRGLSYINSIGYSILQTSDGGYIVGGGQRAWILKLDASGDTLWTTQSLIYRTIYCIAQTDDDGYIAAGCHRYGSPSSTDYLYLIKIDSTGDSLWTRRYGGDVSAAYSIAQTSDGGYVAVGKKGFGNSQVYIVKTDNEGDTLWTRTYGYSYRDEVGFSIIQTPDEGFVIVGATDYTGRPSFLADKIWFLKLDSCGDTLWTRTYGYSANGYSVAHTTDGGYIIVGEAYIYPRGYDVYLVKIDSIGDTIWTKTYGGTNDDIGYSVKQTPDAGYIITGMKSYGEDETAVYLIKTDSLGNIVWVKEIPQKPSALSLAVFPNPFNSAVTISAPENAIVEIFDINGRSITEFDGGDQIWTPEASVGSGIYLVRAKIGDKDITKRVVYLK